MSMLTQVFFPTDDPAAVHGMPISLQLAARRFEEEKVIEMTKKVLSAL